MTPTPQPPGDTTAAATTTGGAPTPAQQRRATAAQRAAAAAQARRVAQRRRRTRWTAAGAAALVLAAGAVFLTARGNDTSDGSGGAGAWPQVGGDLHTVAVVADKLFVAGHAAVGVSTDGGKQWTQVPSLQGADPMGWASTDDAVLVGGHPGLFRSTDGGTSFTQVSGANTVGDVHALGGAGQTVYLASPQAGVLASTDGGGSWQVRNPAAGRSFMGTILVDPKDPARLIAPDMAGALSASSDGGRSWKPLGGPAGAMAAAWDPRDTDRIIAVGMDGGQLSTDGGATWKPADLPAGTSAIGYDPAGTTLYAGVLDGERARVYRSTDGGLTWSPTA